MFCICGLYLRVNKDDPQVAYIDICDKRNLRRSKFQYYNKQTHSNKELYKDLNCNKTIYDENDDGQWAQIPTSFNHFKCAKLNSPCESYVVSKSTNRV